MSLSQSQSRLIIRPHGKIPNRHIFSICWRQGMRGNKCLYGRVCVRVCVNAVQLLGHLHSQSASLFTQLTKYLFAYAESPLHSIRLFDKIEHQCKYAQYCAILFIHFAASFIYSSLKIPFEYQSADIQWHNLSFSLYSRISISGPLNKAIIPFFLQCDFFSSSINEISID